MKNFLIFLFHHCIFFNKTNVLCSEVQLMASEAERQRGKQVFFVHPCDHYHPKTQLSVTIALL